MKYHWNLLRKLLMTSTTDFSINRSAPAHFAGHLNAITRTDAPWTLAVGDYLYTFIAKRIVANILKYYARAGVRITIDKQSNDLYEM